MAAAPYITIWRFIRRLIMLLSLLVLIAILIFEIGAFFRISILYLPSWAFTSLTSYFVLLVVICCGAYFLVRGRRSGSRSTAVAITVAAVTAINLFGAALIERNLVATGQKLEIPISLLESFKSPTSDTHARISHVSYTMFESAPLNLTIYRSDATSGRSQPALIYVHGGGWISGSADARQADLKWFAQQGWVVFAVDYALSTTERHLWDVTGGQIACSMAWVGAHAAQFGADPSRLYMIGESAGGNLVLNASYMANANSLRSPCGGSVPHVRAVVADYPVIDAVNVYNNPDSMQGPSARAMLIKYTGGSPERYPGRYESISSERYLTAAAPPTMIIVGEKDSLVPPQPTYDFAGRARSDGVQVELVRVPYMDHAFDVFPHSLGNQLFRRGAAKFLRQH